MCSCDSVRRLKCAIWTPQKPAPAGDVRVTQVETPSLLGCSIFFWLVTHTHTYWGGGDLPTPSIPTCPLSSILPSILSPLCPHVWCAARGHQWRDQPGPKNKSWLVQKEKNETNKNVTIKQRHEIWSQTLLQNYNTFEELVELKVRFGFLECDFWQEPSLCRARLSLSASELWD